MSKGFLVVDHVADAKIKAWGPDMDAVFKEAAKGMWFVMFGDLKIPTLRTWKIAVCGMDMEDVLISFLNEQLALFEIDGLVVSKVDQIDFKGQEPNGDICLRSSVRGCVMSDLDVEVDVQVKAATFHELQLTPTEAWITFDV